MKKDYNKMKNPNNIKLRQGDHYLLIAKNLSKGYTGKYFGIYQGDNNFLICGLSKYKFKVLEVIRFAYSNPL